MKFWNFKTIKNEADNTENVELRIEGDIVSDDTAWFYEWFDEPCASPNAFKNELNEYAGKDITVWIDSYGGDVFAAAGIFNALKEHKGQVITKIDGKAMSAASVIAMAGDEILMSPVAIMMIHNPLTSASGDMREMRKTAEILDSIKETIINAYATKTGKSRNAISSMMDDETWMSANVAVKNGFADGILYENQAQVIEVGNIKDFNFNRLSITNNLNEMFEKIFEQFIKEDPKIDDIKEKEKLLIELDLI